LLTAGVIVLPGVGAIFPSDIPEDYGNQTGGVGVDERQRSVETRGNSDGNCRNTVTSGGDTTAPNRMTFELTAYIAMCSSGCTGITATGIDVRNTLYHDGKRVVATDPDVVPLGSVLRITFANGREIEAIAADTGGAIDGRDIDLLVGSRDKALRIGRQAVEVEIVSTGE
jgi:3D (Asp-Asp-Asp) domain-containing protein